MKAFISIPSGDRLVQELQIGDEVQTLAGRKTIKWIGYNKFTNEEGGPWQDSVMPIRVARFAIGDHTPNRDLYLSPLHCIFFNEALIPVMYLINDTTIAQSTPSDRSAIEYYHVELDTHEVIYAEGALVESYDGSNRENFSNFVQYERFYGVEPPSNMTPPAPILRYQGRRQELTGFVSTSAIRSKLLTISLLSERKQCSSNSRSRRNISVSDSSNGEVLPPDGSFSCASAAPTLPPTSRSLQNVRPLRVANNSCGSRGHSLLRAPSRVRNDRGLFVAPRSLL
jgi:Hint domain